MVRNYLRTLPALRSLSIQETAKYLSVGSGKVNAEFSRLARKGILMRSGEGQYVLQHPDKIEVGTPSVSPVRGKVKATTPLDLPPNGWKPGHHPDASFARLRDLLLEAAACAESLIGRESSTITVAELKEFLEARR